MTRDGYMTFCPIAKACELLEPRWTLLILCEIFGGQNRFNEIRRFLPTLSPTLLSKRLREMETNGLVVRVQKGRDVAYFPTQMADEIRPVVRQLGIWAHRNISKDVTLDRLDARVLMWNIWQKVNSDAMPPARQWVIQFTFPAAPAPDRSYWLVARHGEPVELCTNDPGQDVDLFVQADLRAMTAAFLGYTSYAQEIGRGSISLIGDRSLVRSFSDWVQVSSYAAA